MTEKNLKNIFKRNYYNFQKIIQVARYNDNIKLNYILYTNNEQLESESNK